MKNPFQYPSLSSYCYDRSSNDTQSLEYSRALTELQVSRHIYLAYNPLSPTSRLIKFNQIQGCLSSQTAISTMKKDRKQNPFLYAKPFQFAKSQPIKYKQTKGLTKWEKKKYLQQYLLENLIQNKDQILTTNNVQLERIIKRDQEPIKIQNRSQQNHAKDVDKSSKGLKKAFSVQGQPFSQNKNENKGFKDDYSFSHDIQLNPYYKQIYYPSITERVLQESQSIKGYSFKRQKSKCKIQMQQEFKGNEDEQSKSIIHRLRNEHETKPQEEIVSNSVQTYKIKKDSDLQYNDSNYKQQAFKMKQVEQNIGSNKRVSINTQSYEKPPRQIMIKYDRYELVNIL